MNRPILELIHEQVAHGLAQARDLPVVGHLGAWLGVIDDPASWSPTVGLKSYRDVAAAGAAFAASQSDDARQSLLEGLGWLRKRHFFISGQPPGLEADPLAFLALAAGVDAVDADADTREWLAALIRQAIERESDDQRSDTLRLALLVIGAGEVTQPPSPLLRTALSNIGRTSPTREEQKEALAALVVLEPLAPERSIFVAAALHRLFAMEAAIDLALPTIEQVVALLRRVPAALKRWPWEAKPKTQRAAVSAQRWDIQNEYHVQSLLWAILRPVFPGLEDEEYLPSVGHKHPRADFLIPTLRLVIEVKYLRQATQFARAKTIEEVSADAGLYLKDGSPYDRMIVFIWDATGSTHHHDELADGIRGLKGIEEVIIVSRPWEWSGSGSSTTAHGVDGFLPSVADTD